MLDFYLCAFFTLYGIYFQDTENRKKTVKIIFIFFQSSAWFLAVNHAYSAIKNG